MAGFPAQTEDGKTVRIVKRFASDCEPQKLWDEDGNEYTLHSSHPHRLVLVKAAEAVAVEAPEAEVESDPAADDSAEAAPFDTEGSGEDSGEDEAEAA